MPPRRVPRDVAPYTGRGFPHDLRSSAPGVTANTVRGGERRWVQSPIAPRRWHGARPCHPQIPARPRVPAWEPCRVPNRASAIPTRPVCVPTRHTPPADDSRRGGEGFFFSGVVFWGLFCCFFLNKAKIFASPWGRIWVAEPGTPRRDPRGRGDTRLGGEGPRWHPAPAAPAPRAVPAVYT